MIQIKVAKNILANISEENDLQKSHLLYNFNNTFFVEKLGKEIKEKVLIVLQKEQQELTQYKATMEALKVQVGEEPTSPIKDSFGWKMDGFEDKIECNFNIYKIEGLKECDLGDYVTDKPVEEALKLKDQYNVAAGRALDCSIEIAMINTILNSYPDNKSYKLTLKEATILGF